MPPASKRSTKATPPPSTEKKKKTTTKPKPTPQSKAKAKAKPTAKANGGTPKQQTIMASLQPSALRRKAKTATSKHLSADDDENGGRGPEDEEMVGDSNDEDASVATKPRRVRQQVTTKNQKQRTPARVIDDSDSEQEEKSEERGPRRQQMLQSAVANKPTSRQNGSGNGNTNANANKDAVLTGSFLLTAGNTSDLSRRLKQTWNVLQQIPNHQQAHQDQDQHDGDVPLEKLRLVCTELLHDKILDHTEPNVRSLAACCFVDLLRVYAPEMPFKSNEELYDAFQLILEQLRCLAIERDDGTNASTLTASSTKLHHLYVLESLASIKSYLLLLGMEYVPEDADESLLVQLFRTLFNTIRKDHSIKMETLMLSIMTTCIEESESIEQNLLDVVLAPLVHSNPSTETLGMANDPAAGVFESAAATARGPYHLAQELIRRTSDHLQSHLSHFFNSVLVDAVPSAFTNKTSELKEHVYTLIYEIHKVNASLLLYVLPNVCMQLQVDEVATRSEAIALMGRLFASSHAEYGHDYMKNFRDFLGRFRDVSKEIRLQMVQVSAIIWQRKAELAALIEKEFVARLADPEWEVRRLVVNEVCDLAANNIDAVSEECLRQVGERMKDKRVVLRKEAMTGLSQVYAAHVSSYWAPEADDEEDEESDLSLGNVVPTANVKKLGWVPDFVLKCFAYPQQELKLRVIQLLDDILLPKALSESCRAKGLLFIYHSLDATAREALRRVFVERAKCQTQLGAFLSARKISRRASTSPSQTVALVEVAKSAFHSGIAPLFTETDNLSKLLDQLAGWKDQTVFKQLGIICDGSTSQQDQRNSRDRLVKAVGSKSPLGEFLKNFCRKLNLLTVSEGTIATYLRFFNGSGLPHHRENRSVTDLLLIVARTTPQLFASFVQNDFEIILTENDDSVKAKNAEDDEEEDEVERDHKVVISLLSSLALFAEYWKKCQLANKDVLDRAATDEIPSEALTSYLKHCCLGVALKNLSPQDDGAAAKFAAQILANFFGESKDIGALVSKLCSKKVLVAPSASTSVSTLHSLHVFAKRCPSLFSQHTDSVSSLWHTLLETYIRQDKHDAKAEAKLKKASKVGFTAAKAAEVRCLAIKVATDLLLYCHDGDAVNLVKRSRELLKLLFELLRSDGRKWGSGGSLPAKYRTAASCNILKLLRHRAIESSLSVAEWHILGFVMQDSAEDVRKAFVKKLSANLMKSSIPHPHKYLSYLVLAATEHSAVMKKHARSLLTVAVERMRRVFEATSARPTLSNVGEGDDEENRQNVNALMVPEYALPYVIHLLAHHPDFPASAASRFVKGGIRGALISDPLWSEQVAYLDFFIDGLMPANTAEADNIAFLLQILTKLSDCHDASDPNAVAIYPLLECAVQLLKRRIKNQSNLKAFPGKIYLPKQLYNSGKATDRRASLKAVRSEDEHEHEEEDQAESTSAVQPSAKKARISASLSPIKPSGTMTTFLTMSSPPLSAKKQRLSISSTTRRRSLVKSPTTPIVGDAPANGDEAITMPTPTPSRRQSLMRKARTQAKTFVADSESEDDSDSFVPRASVASRVNKRDSAASQGSRASPTSESLAARTSLTISAKSDSDEDETPQRATPPKRGRPSSITVYEEIKGGSDAENDDDEDMTSFRASRRRRRS